MGGMPWEIWGNGDFWRGAGSLVKIGKTALEKHFGRIRPFFEDTFKNLQKPFKYGLEGFFIIL